jgi:hypothetical protein
MTHHQNLTQLRSNKMIAFLHLARIFGVVPFQRVENRKLKVPKSALRLSLMVQSFMVTLYIIYAFQHEQIVYLFSSKSSGGTADERLIFTSLTIVTNVIIDILNLSVIIHLSQRNHKLANVLLKRFADVDDNKLFDAGQPQWKKDVLLAIFTSLIYIARVSFVFSQYDKYKVSFNIGVRFAYGMTLVTEQLISLMCLEMKSRYKKLHSLLILKVGCISYKEVHTLSSMLISLRDAHCLLMQHVRKFLLLDISQLVLLVTTGILNIFLCCLVPSEGEEQKSASWCATNGVFAADCLWRVCFLVRNCGALKNEVRIYSFQRRNVNLRFIVTLFLKD